MLKTLFKPKTPPPVVLQEKEVRTLAVKQIEKMDFTPPEFRDWRESVTHMTKIRESIFCALKEKPEKSPEFLPSWALWLATGAAIKTLERINSDHLNCAVPWDTKTGFPSLPSMAADARKYGETLKNGHRPLALILDSFCAWTTVFTGYIECCCGQTGFRKRPVEYNVVMNHSFSSKDGEVIVTQFVGIQNNDIDHLKTHFFNQQALKVGVYINLYKPSKVLENTNVIWLAVNRLKFSGEAIIISEPFIETSGEFDSAKFCDVFMETIQSVPDDLAGSTERRRAC